MIGAIAVVEAAARHQVMLVVHEPIKDTGIRRTYPNMMTREGACGQEYNAWGGDNRNRPDHTTILPMLPLALPRRHHRKHQELRIRS